MGKYAENTTVPVERSVEQVRRTVERYGGESFTYGMSPSGGVVQFQIGPRWVKFKVSRPDDDDQEWKRRWRVLLISIKARLERLGDEDSTVDAEFLPYIMLPDGSTVGERVGPQIDQAYSGDIMAPDLKLELPSGETKEN